MQNSIKFFLFFFELFPSKLFCVTCDFETHLRMSKCSLSMSDLCISPGSVVNGRRHVISCGVYERWQHRIVCVEQNKQCFFPMVKLFQANETFYEQYKHVIVDYTTMATFFVAMTLKWYIGL